MQKQLELLQKYGIEVRGVRGQHFLIDPNIQRKIVETVSVKPGDMIVEIGPGLGAITELLLESGAEVIAIETDVRFCEILKSEYSPAFPNLKVVNADVLKTNFERLIPKKKSKTKLKVVGNLPYYITSPILFFLVSNRTLIDEVTIMVQKEIADRLLAQPGSKDYGRLSLFVRFYAEVERAFNVSRTCFSPKPKVDSSIVKLTFRTKEVQVNETLLFEIIKHAFGHRRKNMVNALGYGLKDLYSKEVVENALKKSGIDLKARGEQLLMKDFLKLTEALDTKPQSRALPA